MHAAPGTTCLFDAVERIDGHGRLLDRRGDIHLVKTKAYNVESSTWRSKQ